MGLVLAVIILAIGVLFLAAYGGTPHGGPTSTCTPINFLGQTYSISGDCRYISIGEIGLGIAFILLAIFIAVASRPRGPGPVA
jgi:hypothetical protein